MLEILPESVGGNPNVHKLASFAPPANLPDLNPRSRKLWSARVSQKMDFNIKLGKLTQFFNGTEQAYDTSQAGVDISWIGFPKRVKTKHPDDATRWNVADGNRNVQDEYLEWSVLRDVKNDYIMRLTFTCEGPEYWQFYANHQKDDAVATIRKMNAPFLDHVPKNAFFTVDESDPNNESLWKYNGKNAYNTSTETGVLTHLVMPANTLTAELGIVADATILRKDEDGKPVSTSDQLIKCAKFGLPGRNSEPRIGISVNDLASTGAKVSVADPVALYMHEVFTTSLQLDPTGDQSNLRPLPEGTFTFTRGDITKSQGLRLEIQIPDGVKSPDGRQLTVSDIFDTKTKQYIYYGGQIADYITMGVNGVAITGGKPAPRRPCVGGGTASNAPTDSFANMVPSLQGKIQSMVQPGSRLSCA